MRADIECCYGLQPLNLKMGILSEKLEIAAGI